MKWEWHDPQEKFTFIICAIILVSVIVRFFSEAVNETRIEIRPHRWGWKVFEAPGVEPVFGTIDQAIGYANTRACFRAGEIRILDSSGTVERTILFSEADRKL